VRTAARTALTAVMLVHLAAGGAWAQAAREVMDQDIDRRIDELKRFLYAYQLANGLWPNAGESRMASYQVPAGGTTTIAVFALLEAGENPKSEKMKLAVEKLAKLNPNDNLYVHAFRAMAMGQVVAMDKDSPYKQQLRGDLEWLIRHGKPPNAAAAGAWGYAGPEATGDNSCSQIALLALWEADRAGVEIDAAVIRQVEKTWIRRQRTDGGWTYPGVPSEKAESTNSMTSAALASIYICRDVLYTTSGPYRYQRAIDSGWEFLAKNLKPDYYREGYLAFCVQRVGMTTGRKFIDKMDWFAVGAAEMCKPDPRGNRLQSGAYGGIVAASFELIFLARGRIPLTFNKLEHGGDEREWNYHNRDVPRFTEYMRRNFEARMRWQVVNVADDVQLMLDAPILLVSGIKPVAFTPAQWLKLKEYTLRGGTILFVPTKRSAPFLDSVKSELEKLYAPERRRSGGSLYEVQKLPAEHPLYSIYGGAIQRGDLQAPMWGCSDGTRMLAVVSQRDIPAAWQRRNKITGKLDYQLGTNFYLYATGYNPMRSKMRPVFVGRAEKINTRVKVARLEHEGNWFTQPYALEYLSQKLTAENRMAIDCQPGVPITAQALAGYQLAWMTGSRGYKLTDKQIADLRGYLDGGGTLFVNAVGGSREFNASAREMFRKLFEGQNVVRGTPNLASPFVTGKIGDFRGPNLTVETKLTRTRVWQKLDPGTKGLQLDTYTKDGRVVAVYAPFGIHDTLDGHTAHAALSYLPGAAMDVAANIVLYAYVHGAEAKRIVRPAPTTAPAAAE